MSNIINPYRFAAAPSSGTDYCEITPDSPYSVGTSGDYKYVLFTGTGSSGFEVTQVGTVYDTIEYIICLLYTSPSPRD